MIVYHHFCFQCFLLCLTSFCVLFLVFPVSLDLTFLMSPMVLSNVVFFPIYFKVFPLFKLIFEHGFFLMHQSEKSPTAYIYVKSLLTVMWLFHAQLVCNFRVFLQLTRGHYTVVTMKALYY